MWTVPSLPCLAEESDRVDCETKRLRLESRFKVHESAPGGLLKCRRPVPEIQVEAFMDKTGR